jgi:hypothetical protein
MPLRGVVTAQRRVALAGRDVALARGGGSLNRVLRVVEDERVGVIGSERVLVLKSPARRSRAGLGVQGVAGVLSLSR